jgi:predicted metal-dependent hydrolase
MDPEAIDGLGREGDETSAPQAVRGACDVRLTRHGRINADYLSHWPPTLNIDAHATTVSYPIVVQFGLPFVNPSGLTAPPSRSDRDNGVESVATSTDRLTVQVSDQLPAQLSDRPEPSGVVEVAASDAPVEFYFVRHHRARRYVLRLDSEGRARVTIPRGGSERAGTAFGLRHLQWIAGQRANIRRLGLGPDERRRLRARAELELPARLLELAVGYGLTAVRISVRDQRTRWGSCGRNGHISLNWRLTLMPEWVRDYVMIHELMHLRRLDHSPEYWRLVADACPEYSRAQAWLRENGASLR